MNKTCRTWANISLENIKYNFTQIKNYVNKTKIMCVVKANAYGHGIVEVAKTLNEADYFAVATLNEAILLRLNNITQPILLLGFFDINSIDKIIENDITISIYDLETAEKISNICLKLNKTVKIHIKIDTGMSRLGFCSDCDIYNTIQKINSLNSFYIEGIYSHFAVADDDFKEVETLKQANLFADIIKKLENLGIFIEFKHISASSGIISYPQFNFNMVRAGIVLYGYNPTLQKNIDLKPSMTVFSTIAQIKNIKKDDFISYGHTFCAKNDMKIAIVTIGYADGYFRANSNSAYILVNGKKAPIVGRICMDMCMVDISEISDTKIGDKVVIFGYFNENILLGADKVSDFSNTIPYEILCAVSSRVPRIYNFD